MGVLKLALLVITVICVAKVDGDNHVGRSH